MASNFVRSMRLDRIRMDFINRMVSSIRIEDDGAFGTTVIIQYKPSYQISADSLNEALDRAIVQTYGCMRIGNSIECSQLRK